MTPKEKNEIAQVLASTHELYTRIVNQQIQTLQSTERAGSLMEKIAYDDLAKTTESSQTRLSKIQAAINHIDRTDAAQLTRESIEAILGQTIAQ